MNTTSVLTYSVAPKAKAKEGGVNLPIKALSYMYSMCLSTCPINRCGDKPAAAKKKKKLIATLV